MRIRSIWQILSLCGGLASATMGQVRSDFDNLFSPGARSSSMAQAVISDPYDAGTMFQNPAALTVLQSGSIFVDHRAQVGRNLAGQTAGFVVPLGEENKFGLAFSALHRGSLLLPGGIESKGSLYSMEIAQSIALAQSFSAGVMAGVGVLRSEAADLMDVTSVLGLHYSPSPEINYAVTLRGLGVRTALKSTSLDETLETPPATLGLGMSMRFPPLYDRQDFTIALANEKQFGTPGLTYRLGVEYYPAQILALRAGAVSGPSETGWRLGLGIRTVVMLLDLAFAPGPKDKRYQVSTLFRI